MKKLQKNERGMAPLIALAIIVVMTGAIVAYITVKAASTNKKLDDSNAIASGSTITNIKEESLAIKEWGVKVSVDNKLGKTTYTASSANMIAFSSEAQKTLPKGCEALATAYGVSRSDGKDLTAEQKTAATHIDDYYYTAVTPKDGCANDKKVSDKLDTAYKNTFKSLKKS
jgi:hypothetical protein